MSAVTEEDVRYLKRQQRFLRMDVHPTQCSIVLWYTAEAAVLGDEGDYVTGERKEYEKIISLRNLKATCNLRALTESILDRCRMIPTVKVQDLVQLIRYLQKRHKHDSVTPSGTAAAAATAAEAAKSKDSDGRVYFGEGFMQEPFEDAKLDANDQAHLDDLENYIELLYEEEDQRLKGTGYILQLFRSPHNLEELVENETLLSALSRVLREDWKTNPKLAINIIYCFFCISAYSVFHPIILKQKVGAQLLDALEYELTRYRQWMKLLADKKRKAEAATDPESEEKVAFTNMQEQIQGKVHLQDKFLRVAIYMLLNLAEDLHTEAKMVKKGLVNHMLGLLDRNNIELLILVCSFLRKLSVIRSNKELMISHSAVKKISRLFNCSHEILVNMALRTLLNLSFDQQVCLQIVKLRLIPKLLPMLDNPVNQTTLLCLLYHLSIHDKHKSVFAYTDMVPKLVQLIVEAPGNLIGAELGSLCVNLALHPRIAELMCGVADDGSTLTGKGVRLLLKRALYQCDPLILKTLRNISVHAQSSIRQLFVPYVADIGQVMVSSEDQECVCDMMGLLGNLTFQRPRKATDDDDDDLDEDEGDADASTKQQSAAVASASLIPEECYTCLRSLITECDALPLLTDKLEQRAITLQLTSDGGWSTALEPLLLAVAMAHDEECALAMAHSGHIELIANRLTGHQDDDDIVLQSVYFFYMTLLHSVTREYCIKETQIPHILLTLMHDNNAEVKKICNAALDIVQEYDGQWASDIQESRFLYYNQSWLNFVQQNAIQEQINDAEERMFSAQMDDGAFMPEDMAAMMYATMHQGSYGDDDGDGMEDGAEDDMLMYTDEAQMRAYAGMAMEEQHRMAAATSRAAAAAMGMAVGSSTNSYPEGLLGEEYYGHEDLADEDDYMFAEHAELLGQPQWMNQATGNLAATLAGGEAGGLLGPD
eukprot:scpid26283/ scgid27679/ Kinesin-associated protein 3; SpKAP115